MKAEDRFWDNIKKTKTCWLWKSSIGKTYGKIHVEGKTVLAHRYSYLLLVGEIPENLVLDHLCRIRWCVNPEHLEPVTQRENILRGVGITAVNANKNKCDRGHKLDMLVSYAKGTSEGRACRECYRINSETYRRKYPEKIKKSNWSRQCKKALKRDISCNLCAQKFFNQRGMKVHQNIKHQIKKSLGDK